jgi:hypothetical protein
VPLIRLKTADAIKSIINNIDERNGSDAGVAGRRLTSTSRKYVPEYPECCLDWGSWQQ